MENQIWIFLGKKMPKSSINSLLHMFQKLIPHFPVNEHELLLLMCNFNSSIWNENFYIRRRTIRISICTRLFKISVGKRSRKTIFLKSINLKRNYHFLLSNTNFLNENWKTFRRVIVFFFWFFLVLCRAKNLG